MKNSVKKQLLVIFIVVTIIPLLFAGIFLFINMNAILMENKQKDIEIQAIDVRNSLSETLIDMVNKSESIVSNHELTTFTAKNYASVYDVYMAYQQFKLFEEYIMQDKSIGTIRYIVDNPSIVTNSNIINLNKEIEHSDWFQQSKSNQQAYFWQVLEDPVTHAEQLSLVRGHFVKERWVGTLLIIPDTDVINNFLSNDLTSSIVFLDDQPVYVGKHIQTFPESSEKKIFAKASNSDSELLFEETFGGKTYFIMRNNVEVNDTWTTDFSLVTLSDSLTIKNDVKQVLLKGLMIVICVVVASFALLSAFLQSFNWRIQQLKSAMFSVSHGDFSIQETISGSDEIKDVYEELKRTIVSLKKLMDENIAHEKKWHELQLLQKESELKRLSSQLNPHFLYNTLEMIRMKALKNQDKEVADIIKLFSKLMRQAYQKENTLTSLDKELEFVELYLKIQQLRFGDRITYDIYVDGVDTSKYQILPMVLQPIVENAFVHGIELDPNSGHLQFNIRESDTLEIEIIDDGAGMTEEKLVKLRKQLADVRSKRIGLMNSQQRIGLYYGKEFGIQVKSIKDVGTRILIKLPKIEGEENDENLNR